MIDLSKIEDTKDSNIEKGFSTKVVFVDHNEPTQYNGGYDTNQQFTTASLQNLLSPNNTLIAKSSTNILRYYEDGNLYKSFPELFPYGIGPKTTDDPNFYKYLLSLSNPLFHRGEVTTIIHNMYERKRLFKSASLYYTTKNNKIKIGQLKESNFSGDVIKYLANRMDPYDAIENTKPVPTFLRSIRAVTR